MHESDESVVLHEHLDSLSRPLLLHTPASGVGSLNGSFEAGRGSNRSVMGENREVVVGEVEVEGRVLSPLG